MKDLILLHGALGCSKDLLPLCDLLQPSYNLHLLDFPGHGENSAVAGEFGIAAFADSFQQLYKKTNTKPHVFGYSMGGYVALYAHLHFNIPLAGLITLGTKYDWNPESAQTEASRLNAEKVEEQFPDWAAKLANSHGPNWKNLMKRTAEMMLELGQQPLLNERTLSMVNFPVFVLRGERDKMVSQAESKSMAAAIPHAEYGELLNQPHPLDRVDVALLASYIRLRA